ncbi:uncharacterized protein BO80DRAFT_401699 [Aspergillus ibericus CBS 121593]|uniref:Uncharacterized protein n=1 Tax=Aspergillus ibericus CBS 121593 TaxID=1448316 RepID=A0A395H7D8_9EURO|nr:hypothetical protein BO80DRAFT_401699 [Aspergillus ibericus CBS 121593]RAL03570.1 hypothetical protein BO80DRAFT_401699 [Aspergillus ibericus CBS 121593]
MSGKQRVTLASMWAFEDIGVSDSLSDRFRETNPQLDLECHYHRSENVLEVDGNLEGCPSQIAKAVSKFIDGQRNKDLLDVHLSATIQDDEHPSSDQGDEGGLLALEDDSDEELIPNPVALVTKFWLSPSGGVGCFSENRFHDFITRIAGLTGTDIAVVEDRRIQVTGKSPEDVDDALAKLSRIERPLSFIANPNVANINATPGSGPIRLRLQSYSSLNRIALGRILADPSSDLSSDLGQMFVTILLSFDEEAQVFKASNNLLNPPHVTEEPGTSRIWNDFTFQGIGKRDEYLALGKVAGHVAAKAHATASSLSAPHPFLTAEKANEVNQWVVQGVEMEQTISATDAESKDVPRIESAPVQSSVPAPKRPPGIKGRRPIPLDRDQPMSTGELVTPERVIAQATEPEDDSPKPRRKWRMTYNANTAGQQTDPIVEAPTPRGLSSPLQGDPRDAQPMVTEEKVRLPPTFDTTRYSINRSAPQTTTGTWGNFQSRRTNPNQVRTPEKKHSKRKSLVDILEPVSSGSASTRPLLSFYHPALVPANPVVSSVDHLTPPSMEGLVIQGMSNNSLDLAGLTFEDPKIPLELSSSASIRGVISSSNDRDTSNTSSSIDRANISCNSKTASCGYNRVTSLNKDRESLSGNERMTLSSSESMPENTQRLASLSRVYKTSDDGTALVIDEAYNTAPGLRQTRGTLSQDKVAELERAYKTEKRSRNEVVTRNFHRTMIHKAPKPSNIVQSKTGNKAKRQATLEDAWGWVKPAKKPSAEASGTQPCPGPKDDKKATPVSQGQGRRNPQTDKGMEDATSDRMNEEIKQLYEALKPTLEAAESFPGSMSLEVQIGLLLIPTIPQMCSERVITMNEWLKIFQPRNGLVAPTTKFISRLTTSGADVDHLVNLKTSKAAGKRRLFEQEYDEYNVSYEYHCRTKTGQLIVIAIDEQGNHSVRQPISPLGGVNLHFPGQTWDAMVAINRVTEHLPGANPELEEAARHMVDYLCIPADRQLLCIFTRLPDGIKVTVEKVFLKRWTRHRFIRSNEAPSDEAQGNSIAEGETTEDIYLQILEVQDLVIGTISDGQAIRARAMQPQEMIREGRLWYEASLISPAIESILKSNATLEVGERAEDWCSADLLGRDAALVGDKQESSTTGTQIGPVASAIGCGGLGDLLRLTKKVVGKADGVGYWNEGPGVLTEGALVAQPAPSLKGLDFEDIESVKEIGSAGPQNDIAGPAALDQLEQEFW